MGVVHAGNTGKSWMASYLSSTASAFVVTNGKLSDIAHAYNNETTVIIDLSRTQAEKIDHIYGLMESFKNGRIFSPKCESVSKTFKALFTDLWNHSRTGVSSVPNTSPSARLLKPCRVIVFANFIHDHLKLSRDRWLVKTLQK